jgi:hypothetical protein
VRYAKSDLEVLRVLREKDQLRGTAYFELHPDELPKPFACWLDGSIFIRDAGFDFFVECFRAASDAFDYFGFARFDSIQIESLIRNLSAFSASIEASCSRDVVFGRYNSNFTRDSWDAVETEDLRVPVKETATQLLAFVRAAQFAGKPLWVLGM